MSQAPVEQQKKAAAASAAAQQSDNIAHALAGAGGGILSMALTYGLPISLELSLLYKVTNHAD
jgi:solute carrier family 25 (peroxisomal adenine nucleotide transporter), member 17